MKIQFKSSNHFAKEINTNTKQVTGIFSVFGVPDMVGDTIFPGAFRDTLLQGVSKIFHLWSHNLSIPPTAVVERIQELGVNDLPPSVRERVPNATGGIEVTRRYIDTELANDVFQAIASGAPLQMSFGFYLSEGDYQYNIATGGMDIYKLQLVETSDVIFGANPHTAANAANKAGSRNSKEDQDRLNEIARLIHELGGRYMDPSEDERGRGTNQTDQTDEQEDTFVVALFGKDEESSLSREHLETRIETVRKLLKYQHYFI